MRKLLLLLLILGRPTGNLARAAEPHSETIAAFESYIRATEARMDGDVRNKQFLVVDRLPDSHRREAYLQLQHGQIYMEELHTQREQKPILIPNGVILHWSGVIFIPKATLSEAIAVIEDYDNQPITYKPEIRRSKLIEHNGNESKIYVQFLSRSILTVVLNVNFDVTDTQFGSTRLQATSRSTHIAEVANPGSPNEHERSDTNDRGYIWRLNNYWRIEEKDGGVYAQNESITLSRSFPPEIAWLVSPIINNIPRDLLFNLLTDTRKALMKNATKLKP